MPVRNVLVCDAGSNVKHDDAALALDVVTVPQPSKLFLACSIPNIEADGAEVGRESEGVDLDTESSCSKESEVMSHGRSHAHAAAKQMISTRTNVLLFKFTSQVALSDW
jgi:hypothetical protein